MVASAETLAVLTTTPCASLEEVSRRNRAELANPSLLAGIAAGDERALSAVYNRASTVVYGMALRMLLDPRDAEEAVTDVFLYLWRKASTFDANVGNASAWLIMIARCRILDRVRNQKTRRQYEEPMAEHWDATSSEPDAEVRAIASCDARRVRAALADLGPAQREVVELAYFRGLTHHEIAEATARPLGTVKTQIRQGLLKMRRLLA